MSNSHTRSGKSSPVPSLPAPSSRSPSPQSNASRSSSSHRPGSPSASHKPSTGPTGTPKPAGGMRAGPHIQSTGSSNSGDSRPVTPTGDAFGNRKWVIPQKRPDDKKSTGSASGTGAPGKRADNTKPIGSASGTGAPGKRADNTKPIGSASGTGGSSISLSLPGTLNSRYDSQKSQGGTRLVGEFNQNDYFRTPSTPARHPTGIANLVDLSEFIARQIRNKEAEKEAEKERKLAQSGQSQSQS